MVAAEVKVTFPFPVSDDVTFPVSDDGIHAATFCAGKSCFVDVADEALSCEERTLKTKW